MKGLGKSWQRKDGVALVMALLFSFLMLAGAATAILYTAGQRQLTSGLGKKGIAVYYAQAAVQHAISKIRMQSVKWNCKDLPPPPVWVEDYLDANGQRFTTTQDCSGETDPRRVTTVRATADQWPNPQSWEVKATVDTSKIPR